MTLNKLGIHENFSLTVKLYNGVSGKLLAEGINVINTGDEIRLEFGVILCQKLKFYIVNLRDANFLLMFNRC